MGQLSHWTYWEVVLGQEFTYHLTDVMSGRSQ